MISHFEFFLFCLHRLTKKACGYLSQKQLKNGSKKTTEILKCKQLPDFTDNNYLTPGGISGNHTPHPNIQIPTVPVHISVPMLPTEAG